MSIVKINWSGGKDSTAAVILHLIRGDKVKIVYYIPMLNDEIPLIRKCHFEHILKTSKKFEKCGAEVYRARGISYFDHVHKIKKRGINKNKPVGTGLGFGFCVFRDKSKIKALERVNVGDFDYSSIGIAADEQKRFCQLNEYKRSILVECNYTEQDCFALCNYYNVLSPIYYETGRDGCAICPNASSGVLSKWLDDYPTARDVLEKIENYCKEVTPEYTPYRGGRWWSDRIKEESERDVYNYQIALW